MFKSLRIQSIHYTARSYSTRIHFSRAKAVNLDSEDGLGNINLDEPVILRQTFAGVPAIAKWFTPLEAHPGFHNLNSGYLEGFAGTSMTLELTRPNPESPQDSSFERFEAPFGLLLSHMTTPEIQQTSSIHLYLAQQPLADLPSPLQADIPVPALLSPGVARLGRGDIYASSLWMGKPPTRTPLHRDPNPNLFVQLAGKKVIRLMKPSVGRSVYEKVRREVGEGRGRANMRGLEMMVGKELEGLESVVWDQHEKGAGEGIGEASGVEAELESGDGLYIPLGWWHAVRGIGLGANASVYGLEWAMERSLLIAAAVADLLYQRLGFRSS